MKQLFKNLFGKGKEASSAENPDATPATFEDLGIFENLVQKQEDHNWNSIPELSKAIDDCPSIREPSRAINREDAQKILELTEDAMAKFPNFDLPRLYNIIAHLKLGDQAKALISFKKGIHSCHRKRMLFGGFAQDFYAFLLSHRYSKNDFNILIAASVAAYKTSDNINFGRLFIAQYIRTHQNHVLHLRSGSLYMQSCMLLYYNDLISAGTGFHGDFLRTMQEFSMKNLPDFDSYVAIAKLQNS